MRRPGVLVRQAELAVQAGETAQMLLMIDNYDSFTYNIAQYLRELGAEVKVVHNDGLTLDQLQDLAPRQLVISPGPGRPVESGISMELIRHYAGRLPILGICLGHQCIGEVFGAEIVRAGQVMHGKTSAIQHSGEGVFAQLPSPFEATRYHSLVIRRETLPECLEVTAWTGSSDGVVDEIMGVRHREMPLQGVQFHPESILTEHGHALLKNFLRETGI